MEELRLVLDPRLGLGADELVAAWNKDASQRAMAEARHKQTAAGTFLDPMLAQGLISLAVSVSGGITSNLILDFIRSRLKAKSKDPATQPAIQTEQRTLPTGEAILVVRAETGR